MAKTRNTEIKGLTSDQLTADVASFDSTVSKLKFDHAVRGLQNPKEIGKAKKEVARLKTEIRSRELSEASSEVIAKRSKIRLRRRLK
jgi:large subunit ribosomal protein L29